MSDSAPYQEVWNALDMRAYDDAAAILEDAEPDESKEGQAVQVNVDWALRRYADVIARTQGIAASEDRFDQKMVWLRARSLFTTRAGSDEAFKLLYQLMLVGDFATGDLALADSAWYLSRIKSKKAAIVHLRRNESYVGERSAFIWALLLVEIGWNKEAKRCLDQLRDRFDDESPEDLEFIEALVAYNLNAKPKEGRRLLKAAIAAQTWDEAVYIMDAANAFLCNGSWAEAETISLLCLEIQPGWKEAYTNLATAALMQGRFRAWWAITRRRDLSSLA